VGDLVAYSLILPVLIRSNILSGTIRRITAAWCKKHDVPIEKIFSKTLVTKCEWGKFLLWSTFDRFWTGLIAFLCCCDSPLGDGSRPRLEVLIGSVFSIKTLIGADNNFIGVKRRTVHVAHTRVLFLESFL
jgi:hypothetical protein